MIVILIKDIKGTGKAGDVVKVSNGYARNMLLPKGLAREATEGNIRNLEKQKAIVAEKKAENRAKAEETAALLNRITVEITAKGGENGRLFGSVTSKDIAQSLKEQEGVDIDRKKIMLDVPIKEVGDFSVPVRIYPEITSELKVKISV